MSESSKIKNRIYGLMHVGAMYPISTLKSLYMDMYDDEKDTKKIGRLLSSESNKKKNMLIKRPQFDNSYFYQLNDKEFIFSDHKESHDDDSIQRLSLLIRDKVQSQTKDDLNFWLTNMMEPVIKGIAVDIIKEEIKTDVVPLIADRITNTKYDFEMALVETMNKMTASLTKDGS
jgi:hypothetical protein